MGHTYKKKLFVAYKLKFKWVSYIFICYVWQPCTRGQTILWTRPVFTLRVLGEIRGKVTFGNVQ